MPLVLVETLIRAPRELCFDLARDVAVHLQSTAQTKERAVAGVTSGLLGLGDTVTWEAVHFGVRQRLTARITLLEPPRVFVDEMVSGAFRSFRHVHRFEEHDGVTAMRDELAFESPLGVLGRLADRMVLERYMRRLLERRGDVIREVAERRHASALSP